jgi:hypothetical protein
MIKRWAWILPVLSSLLASVLTAPVLAQYGPAMGYDPAALMQAQYMAQAMMAPPGMMPAAHMQAPGAPPGALPDVYGSYGSMPLGPGQDAPIAIDGPAGCGCPYCGGHGCEMCGFGGHHGDHGLLGECLGICGPYADGGCAAVRWFDVAADYMYLRRDDPGRNLALTSQGINGPIVLQTNDLDFDEAAGFRFIGCLQVGPGSNVEFAYFGTFHHQDSAFVRRSGSNDLFSVFSDFGLDPFNGFQETDRSDYQQIDYTSTFDSFEINFRQRWMAPNCRYQGSWVCGVRHFILDEKFRYFTSSSANGIVDINGQFVRPAQARFDVDTTNNLTGFQLGADMWLCILPGLRLGAEAKAGVYGNHMNANTTAGVNTGAPTFIERISINDVSFVGQADLTATWRVNYNWTARAGYQFLYVDGVALATENFNIVPPAITNPAPPLARVPTINDNGNVFYHGWFAGLEFMW